jgi:hypothetical protein
VTSSPIITTNTITGQKAILDVTPAWFEPVKPVSRDKIRLPTNYDKNSATDVRTYNCLSLMQTSNIMTAIIALHVE